MRGWVRERVCAWVCVCVNKYVYLWCMLCVGAFMFKSMWLCVCVYLCEYAIYPITIYYDV